MEKTLLAPGEALLTAHTPEKITAYLDFINIFVKTIEATRSRKSVKDLGAKMMCVGLSLMVLAPDHVTKAYIFWLALSTEGNDPEAAIDALGDLVIEMRKDLIGDTTCSRDDAVGIFLRDQI